MLRQDPLVPAISVLLATEPVVLDVVDDLQKDHRDDALGEEGGHAHNAEGSADDRIEGENDDRMAKPSVAPSPALLGALVDPLTFEAPRGPKTAGHRANEERIHRLASPRARRVEWGGNVSVVAEDMLDTEVRVRHQRHEELRGASSGR